MDDLRKSFILSCIENIHGTQCKFDSESEKSLNNFLDNVSCSMLQGFVVRSEDQEEQLVLSTELENSKWNDECMCKLSFVKLKSEPLTDANVKTHIQVQSMMQSPIHSLYHSVNKVYAPILLNENKWGDMLSQNMKKLIMDLNSGLGHTVKDENCMNDISDDKYGILNVVDEIEYWENKKHKKDEAAEFIDVFQNIKTRFETMNALEINSIDELLEDTQNCLDDVWRADVDVQYPQKRMENMLNLVSTAVSGYVVHVLSDNMMVWTSPFYEVKPRFQTAIALVEKWTNCMTALTTAFWPSCGEHPWVGERFVDVYFTNFQDRLEQVFRLRTTYEELILLLPSAERTKFIKANHFSPLLKLNALNYNPYTNAQWKNAVAAFEENIQPIESHVSENLRTQLENLKQKPQIALRELQRYQHLLQRPFIAKELSAERENVLGQIAVYVEQIERDFDQRSANCSKRNPVQSELPPGAKNLSPKVGFIVWGQQLWQKMKQLQSVTKMVLADLPLYKEFKENVDSILLKISTMVDEQVLAWQEEVQDALDDGQISLEMSGRLMEIDVDGNLVVNYSERLVSLLREVRQLNEIQPASSSSAWVPKKIAKLAQEGEKFYRYGVTLKKVANFYNTMESLMIEEQKPLLLNALLSFEEVVKNPSGARQSAKVTWSNPEECEEYVQLLQQACETLSLENSKLRSAHTTLNDETLALMNIDLLRQRDKWKTKWTDLKTFMASVAQKYPPKHIVKWELHWDHQVYKALEASYQMGLESLNQNLSEIKTELVFSQRRLQFKPPLEEMQATYYKEMKKFVSVPNSFQGFGQNSKLYSSMGDQNANSLVQVYSKAESLFSKLAACQNKFEPWTVVGRVADLDAMIEESVIEMEQWENNFKITKSKLKECDKIEDYIRVDCVLISVLPLKSTIEEGIQRLNDSLVLGLRKSVHNHLNSLDEYLDTAMEKLNTRPKSIEDIGVAKKDWKSIEGQKSSKQGEFKKCAKKKQLLSTVAGANIDLSEVTQRLTDLPSRWDNFEIALEAFNEMIEEQRENLKVEIESRVVECNVSMDKFSQRWHALKPTEIANWDDSTVDSIFVAISDWRQQFNEIKELTITLISNCETFQMPSPQFDGLDTLEEDISIVESSWGLYKEFTNELKVISDQDWITFRSNIFELQDFGGNWVEKIKGKPRTPVSERITDQVSKLRKAIPALKFCRGEPFKEEHWTQLFRKIGVPKGIRLDNLNVGHFLNCLPALEEPSTLQFVKIMQARAQGEVTIREALQELRAWTETAEIQQLDHEENGRSTPIIKEWKEILLELGDNQSLLASLKESQFFKPFADQAGQYELKMSALDTYLSNLNIIQRKWVYLEPIFGRGALPAEQGRFKRVDDEFRDIVLRIKEEPKLFNLADEGIFPHLGDRLSLMVDQLERCQKALADFLEEKRSKMPRFYFIGDDDLVRPALVFI